MSDGVIIFGGGGHAKVVLDTLQQTGICVQGIIDNKYQGELFGVKRYPNIPDHLASSPAIIAIGDNRVRKRIAENFNLKFTSAVHPTALVSAHASFGEGAMVLHRSIIQAGATLGRHVIVNTAAQIDHDCTIGDYAHLAPGSILCGTISVGEGTLVGAGAVVKPNVRIGNWVTIGSGAVVVKDVPDYAVVIGNPGKILKFTPQ
jgi:sugar O-acyltransferase (sialic acid O-acetyltransferase NeuD family)